MKRDVNSIGELIEVCDKGSFWEDYNILEFDIENKCGNYRGRKLIPRIMSIEIRGYGDNEFVIVEKGSGIQYYRSFSKPKLKIEIYNSQGIKVFTTTSNKFSLKHLPKGIYYATLFKNGELVKKQTIRIQ
ncbi:T9SS type A sorting domain-containing protein [Ornithobacterium rhinotracheale]|uniref:T9SS type A sorting domain-containing protein n=1 Tax=Ornithobacterium rhinotracheale TaxID=28251 RepID=UPI001FF48429|nr:T9SS type A sorting domain-containing protein [Ornithobacterium rhinotracheale]MCK0203826.1 T9SS type A sorting domain-containing protein [Ornithobacterium rhinotracheale]